MKQLLVAFVMLIVFTPYSWAEFSSGQTAYEEGDFAVALQELLPHANKGNAEAQYLLGKMYSRVDGFNEMNEAIKWYRKAAENGYDQAQATLGMAYQFGLSVPKDINTAIEWYSMSANQGNADAQAQLGGVYLAGEDVPKDNAEAAKWYNKAAVQGDATSQLILAIMYKEGKGVPVNSKMAVEWFRKAAEQGLAQAQYKLGYIYEIEFRYMRTSGVDQDYTQAVRWYRKAADQGDAKAQEALGSLYYRGKGVPTDFIQSYAWHLLAAAQGNKSASGYRTLIENKLTPEQVVEGQKMARQFSSGRQKASQPAVTPLPQLKANTFQNIAGLQRQLEKIESLIAKKTVVVEVPQKATPAKFSIRPVIVDFAKGNSHPEDIAVIIGNANYEKGKDIPNVTPAYADATGIKKYVEQALGIREENIIFLKDANQAELTVTFGSETNHKGQLFNYVKPGKSRVFVYYSGHGAPGGEEGDSYLVPSNAQASLIDLNGYSLNTLYNNLSKIPAKSVTVVLEACFSGVSQSGSVIAKASPIYLRAKENGVPSNITVIAAGAANQIASWEQDSSSGLFTKYFLKGMSGEADTKPYGNSDGKVGYDELGRYFKETLTYYARRYYGREQTAQIVEGRM